jgi:hypothetical protein
MRLGHNIFALLLSMVFLGCMQKEAAPTKKNKAISASQLASGDSSDTETGSSITANLVSPASDIVLDADFLNKMPTTQLKTFYTSRTGQVFQDKQDFSINDQIANALCERIKELRKSCVVSHHLTPAVNDTLHCGSSEGTSTLVVDSFQSPSFSVVLTDTSGNPLSAVDGTYVLVANTNYRSDPFGAGASKVRFVYQGAGNIDSPQLKQIYNLEIRRADEDANAVVNGKGKPMPGRDSFFVQLSYNNFKLTDGSLMDVSNATFVGYRYMIALDKIVSESRSARCQVTQAEIDSIKNQIRTSIQSQDQEKQKASVFRGDPSVSKEEMISATLAAQDQITQLRPMLDDSSNRLLKLTAELNADQLIGCHVNEPIVQFTIDIQGKRNDPKELGDKYDRCPKIAPTGPGSILNLEMGSSISISIDQNKYGLGGSPWAGKPSDQALVGDIQYLRISKMGITIVDIGPVCKSGILGFGSSCAQVCHEEDTFSVTGIKISVDTPSVSGVTIFENKSLNVTFGSTLYAPDAVTVWNADNFRSDPNWTKFMYDTNCDTVK